MDNSFALYPLHAPDRARRKLIRWKQTKAFLTKDGGWSYDITKAYIVSGYADLKEIRSKFPHIQMEIYHSFEDSHESDFVVPVT